MLTPATYDAAYRLGWALKRAGEPMPYQAFSGDAVSDAIWQGMAAYTDEAEAERMERQ